MPKSLFKLAYDRELIDDFDRKLAKVKKETELEKAKEQLKDVQIVVAKKEKEVIKEQGETETKERRKWTKEYQTFRRTNHYKFMKRIMQALYEDGGDIRGLDGYGNRTRKLVLPTETLAYLDSKDIIEIPSYGQIKLTSKGKYFMDRFQN